jgi:S-DNA-T family DNA segregation ATPase FtsK/SpoIIIE
MAKKKKKKNHKKEREGGRGGKNKDKDPLDYIKMPELDLSPDTKKSIYIVLILGFGLLCFLSLIDSAGLLGEYLRSALQFGFGWGKWFIPVLLVLWGVFLYKGASNFFRGANYLGLFLFIISFQPFLHFFYNSEEASQAVQDGRGGGYTGLHLASFFQNILGFWGGLLIILCLLLISVLLMFNTSLIKVVGEESIIAKLFYPFRWVAGKIFLNRRYKDEEDDEEEIEDEPLQDEENEPSRYRGEVETSFSFERKGIKENREEDGVEEGGEKATENIDPEERGGEGEFDYNTNDIKIDLPLSLLDNKAGKPVSGNTRNNSLVIQRTMENFGIPVEMGEASVGPTITRYTFKPAEGIKLSRVTALSNDLALALAAHPIRIEAPIPGRSLVGIEVPNKAKAVVSLREILSGKEHRKSKGYLKVALGRDVTGKTWSYDITKMPHLLIAGATNSGKSVCINSIIVSLLYHNNPSDLRFIMVDPKRVELPIYNGIPHLLTPVITDVTKTVNALKWCLNEMDRRFEMLSQYKKRDIQSYNEVAKEKMPHLVFIVDELADLMIVAAKEIEASIIRLTQMARAVGIHIILATQRPSVDVITGLIKANVPARIAFSVASGVDSKTILDTTGAEKLIGQGDMLFTTAEFSRPKRIQGVFIGDTEIKRVINHIKEQAGHFEYVNEITEKQKVEGVAAGGMDDQSGSEDVLFEQAKDLVIQSGKASASFLQRRLSVGYARAARLIDELEEEGIVGPANGSKPREIFVNKEEYESAQNQPTSGTSLHNREESEAPANYLAPDPSQESEPEENSFPEPETEENKEENENKEEEEDVSTFGRSSGEEEEEEDEEDGMYFAK